MDLKTLAKNIDAETAQAFVSAVGHVIDALLLEAARIGEVATPATRDYDSATLPRSTPPTGWLSHEELRRTAQKMSEAIAAEKWAEGVTLAIGMVTRLAK